MLEIEAIVTNNKNYDYSFKQRTFFQDNVRTVNLSFEGYNDFAHNENLNINIRNINYNNVEQLSIEELRFIAEKENVDFYWMKSKETLINDLKESEEELNNG